MQRFAESTIIAVVLALGALNACNCETETFVPGARYTPDTCPKNTNGTLMPCSVLDFGKVSVASEKTLHVGVGSSGGAALKLLAVNLEPTQDAKPKFRVKVPDILMGGLTPGRTSSITVTYRPCPQAWVDGTADSPGTTLTPNFDYSMCGQNPDSADLVTVEEKTKTGGTRITMSGQPVPPPAIVVECSTSMPSCNMPAAMLLPCVSMDFGNVSSDATVGCDLIMKVHNCFPTQDGMSCANVAGKSLGDLAIERIEITAEDINELGSGTRHDGAELGFNILDMDGNPMMPTSADPFVVTIPEGKSDGSKMFKIRYTGARSGTWFGSKQYGTGLRLYSNDPANKIVSENISGTGSAPDIQIFPKELNFGPVEQGTTKTLTATVTNAGTAPLTISALGFMTDQSMTKFKTTTSKGMPQFMVQPNEMFALRVSYTPNASGNDSDTLEVGNNDKSVNGLVKIPVTGGAVPKLKLSPSDTLTFPVQNPPSPTPRTEQLIAANIGYGDLQISRLEIVGAGGMPSASVMDFTIQECPSSSPQSCDPNITLCPPSNSACTSAQTTFHVSYQNHDITETDFAQLLIHTNDPTDPIHTIVLEAHDVPCFPPNAIITVDTQRPCKGMPVNINGTMSTPGGQAGMTTITGYTWSFSFTPPPTPAITPANAVNASFIPATAGIYILNLDVGNSCGMMSQSSASETISVAENCN